MESEQTKLQKAITVSEDILEHIENNDLSFENILLMCIKLARLRDDYVAIKWLTAELAGYRVTEVNDLSPEEIDIFVKKSGRLINKIDETTKENVVKYWTLSISEIESEIQNKTIALENLKPPHSYTPAIKKNSSSNRTFGASSIEFVVEKYQDVLNNIKIQSDLLSFDISGKKALLSKIKTNVHKYVLNINIQLRFENNTESIFQETKIKVDKILTDKCPDVLKIFVTAYERLKSENPEEWSQAMSSCRNTLKAFADFVFPPQKDKYKRKSGEEIDVTDDKYKNRIIAYIENYAKGDKGKYLESRLGDLVSRVHLLNDLLSKGTHVGLELNDIKICIIDTYLLIGSLIK